MSTVASGRRGPPRILAIGGGGLSNGSVALHRHLIDLCARDHPRVCLLPSAGSEAAEQIVHFYDAFGGRAEPSHLRLDRNAMSPDLLRRHLLAQDAIYVGGGGLLDVLARWRAHGVDRVLREAWRDGTVLAGHSAGSLCWFEAAVTGDRARPARALGLVPASNSVHWSSAPRRRRAFIDCVGDGMPAGWGVDDGAALVFEGTALASAVSVEPGARAWWVERSGSEVVEEPVPMRLLDGAPAGPAADPAVAELRALRRFHTARGRYGVRRVRTGP